MSSSAAASETSRRIFDVTERLVQTRGFNAFSHADIAGVLQITKLRYHFQTRTNLGKYLIERYEVNSLAALGHIDAVGGDAETNLRAYAGLDTDILDNGAYARAGCWPPAARRFRRP